MKKTGREDDFRGRGQKGTINFCSAIITLLNDWLIYVDNLSF